jgi:branched-chain amino acid transport system substrate-binding protein
MNLSKPLLAFALSASCVIGAWAAESVKVGLVLPMSGPFSADGKQIANGAKLYLATKGDTFGGRRVELFIKDDSPGTAGDMSKRLAQELVVKDKVDILAGFALTPSVFAVAPAACTARCSARWCS